MNQNAYLCTTCNHTQRNRAVVLSRYIHLQSTRYFAILLGIIVPTIVVLYLSVPEVYFFTGLFEGLHFVYAILVLYAFGILMLRFVPDSFFEGMNLPGYLESIKYAKGMAIWNWILYPVLSGIAVYGVLSFADAKPSDAEFQAYAKANIARRITTEQFYDCRLFSVYGVATKQDSTIYLCAGGRISPLDPSYFEHLSD